MSIKWETIIIIIFRASGCVGVQPVAKCYVINRFRQLPIFVHTEKPNTLECTFQKYFDQYFVMKK